MNIYQSLSSVKKDVDNTLSFFKYIDRVTSGSNTVKKTLGYGLYLFISNTAHWSEASGIWFVSINPGSSKVSNIVSAQHCSLSVSGKTVSWTADSYGSEAVIYKFG